MTPMQILNQLYAEKKVTLSFPKWEARENFRQRIYKLKKDQDAAITAVLDEERLVLRAKTFSAAGENGDEFILQMWLEEKKLPTFTVLSIEENDGRTGTGKEKIPENLGDSTRSSVREESDDKSQEDKPDGTSA